MEGVWETRRGVAAVLFALPDEAARQNRAELAIPGLASLYLTHDARGEVRGLNDFPGKTPPVAPVFFAFRAMVGIGVLMLAVAWMARWRLRGGREPGRTLARMLVAMSFSGWVAVLAGWWVAEIGRQPWLVTGVLTTAQAAGPVPTQSIALTLALYILLYVALALSFSSVVFHRAGKADKAAAPPAASTRPCPT